MEKKLSFFLAVCFLSQELKAPVQMTFSPFKIQPSASEDSLLDISGSLGTPGEESGFTPDAMNFSPEEMTRMQDAMFEMFDNIPESQLFDLCDKAMSQAEAQAQASGKSLDQYLQDQFAQMESSGFSDKTSPLFAAADFPKDSSTPASSTPDKDKTDTKASASAVDSSKAGSSVEQSSSTYGSDRSGNWLNKRSYSVESKNLMSKAQDDLSKIAAQKLKLLDQSKDIDDAISKFYKESGDLIGKTLAKSPDKKKQSPSFAMEAVLEQQLKKVTESKDASPDSDEDSSQPDYGVTAYKIELVANECRKIMDSTKSEIKKLQELEKMLSSRTEALEKIIKEANDKYKTIADKVTQIDHTYNDTAAQKLYCEIEQLQQALGLTRQFLETDETANMASLKSSFDTTSKSIMSQIQTINGKVTSVLNPFEKTL